MERLNELCATCSTVDFFTLFTGPRYFPEDGYHYFNYYISFGTLAEVSANTSCPCCRLLQHELYTTDPIDRPLSDHFDFDASKVQVTVHPVRADFDQQMIYLDEKTRDTLATKLKVHLVPLEGLLEHEKDRVPNYFLGYGIQLLSPDSVDPSRPLLNGYQATTMNNNLDLLKRWMNTCVDIHTCQSNGGTCVRSSSDTITFEYGIRVIDVKLRTIIEKEHPNNIDYAVLSYVWGKDQHTTNTKDASCSPSRLPSRVSKVIDNAIFVCERLSVPYLWVDRYYIDQHDPVKKTSEIQAMRYIYHYAKLTLIAAVSPESHIDSISRLLPSSGLGDIEGAQRVETVQGRKYITALPTLYSQIHRPQRVERAWTMQEGQLSNRCAFFGGYDISFVCGSGQARESLHSGPYAHEAEMPAINTASKGRSMLSWLNWQNGTPWEFRDYDSLVESYSSKNYHLNPINSMPLQAV